MRRCLNVLVMLVIASMPAWAVIDSIRESDEMRKWLYEAIVRIRQGEGGQYIHPNCLSVERTRLQNWANGEAEWAIRWTMLIKDHPNAFAEYDENGRVRVPDCRVRCYEQTGKVVILRIKERKLAGIKVEAAPRIIQEGSERDRFKDQGAILNTFSIVPAKVYNARLNKGIKPYSWSEAVGLYKKMVGLAQQGRLEELGKILEPKDSDRLVEWANEIEKPTGYHLTPLGGGKQRLSVLFTPKFGQQTRQLLLTLSRRKPASIEYIVAEVTSMFHDIRDGAGRKIDLEKYQSGVEDAPLKPKIEIPGNQFSEEERARAIVRKMIAAAEKGDARRFFDHRLGGWEDAHKALVAWARSKRLPIYASAYIGVCEGQKWNPYVAIYEGSGDRYRAAIFAPSNDMVYFSFSVSYCFQGSREPERWYRKAEVDEELRGKFPSWELIVPVSVRYGSL
ncbi:hypothetical protein HYW32_02460 [Candidatus Berkelbacteria bacterium]|nr:hypothetical protein [Candidatus Berkelbacteria bacterium]